MQQFTVPQFIDVEDKIFGPITARQFVILMAGFMLIGVCYKLFDFALFVFLGIMIFSISGVFAFFRINGMPFHYFILNFIQTTKYPNLRVWNNHYGKDIQIDNIKKDIINKKPIAHKKSYSTSRLAELSLIVDTAGAYKGESDSMSTKIKLEF